MASPKTYSGNGLPVTIGDPENITKAECLQLARTGKEAWNAWRRESGVRFVGAEGSINRANFSTVDFSNDAIAFAGFEFGRAANFENGIFGAFAKFEKTLFGLNALPVAVVTGALRSIGLAITRLFPAHRQLTKLLEQKMPEVGNDWTHRPAAAAAGRL